MPAKTCENVAQGGIRSEKDQTDTGDKQSSEDKHDTPGRTFQADFLQRQPIEFQEHHDQKNAGGMQQQNNGPESNEPRSFNRIGYYPRQVFGKGVGKSETVFEDVEARQTDQYQNRRPYGKSVGERFIQMFIPCLQAISEEKYGFAFDKYMVYVWSSQFPFLYPQVLHENTF